ncbi:MAG: DUF72 domain-containing protein [Verrucomicrobia bacterium]|nr:DUF72 domain-containing protein [Verrucomicrobiota bacterium]
MTPAAPTFDRAALQAACAGLAAQGVFIGTSSWKYPGWCGMLYEEGRYAWRGKFAASRFNNHCLAEYAEVFKTVCVDAAYYKFPDHRYLEGLVSQAPADFLFAFKVTDEITIKKFSNLPRFGRRAGQPNENFLNADLFAAAFLGSCAAFRPNIGLLMFEFSKFYPSDFARGQDFVAALDEFLGKLPQGWPYGVEIRNRHWLREEYFHTLTRHGVAHVFNSWQDMPPVGEQLALPGSRTQPDLCAVRFLLRPGRKYEEAVNLFSPYNKIKEVNDEGRAAGAKLIAETAARGGKGRAFLYVNNRFEGNALETIAAMIASATSQPGGV